MERANDCVQWQQPIADNPDVQYNTRYIHKEADVEIGFMGCSNEGFLVTKYTCTCVALRLYRFGSSDTVFCSTLMTLLWPYVKRKC